VDAARPTVAWARRNAQLSGLEAAPIRWLIDDADTFVAREVRRSRRYAGVVLDPPTYGHGPAGTRWHIDARLPGLLAGVARLAPRFVLLTAHTPGWDGRRLGEELARALRIDPCEGGELSLTASSGATLSLGAFARVIIDR
jgi:23S rRNA (cytosine1962-C5)-methyltransferase